MPDMAFYYPVLAIISSPHLTIYFHTHNVPAIPALRDPSSSILPQGLCTHLCLLPLPSLLLNLLYIRDLL